MGSRVQLLLTRRRSLLVEMSRTERVQPGEVGTEPGADLCLLSKKTDELINSFIASLQEVIGKRDEAASSETATAAAAAAGGSARVAGLAVDLPADIMAERKRVVADAKAAFAKVISEVGDDYVEASVAEELAGRLKDALSKKRAREQDMDATESSAGSSIASTTLTEEDALELATDDTAWRKDAKWMDHVLTSDVIHRIVEGIRTSVLYKTKDPAQRKEQELALETLRLAMVRARAAGRSMKDDTIFGRVYERFRLLDNVADTKGVARAVALAAGASILAGASSSDRFRDLAKAQREAALVASAGAERAQAERIAGLGAKATSAWLARTPQTGANKATTGSAGKKCFRCRGQGHVAKDCPRKGKGGPEQDGTQANQ